jgi:heme-degrading monooxygenase HmoA
MRYVRTLPWIAASLAAAFAAAVLLPGCRVSTSFRGPGYSRDAGVTLEDDDDEVVVVVTYAQLDNTRRAPFDAHSELVVQSLATQPGHIGYSRRKRLFGTEAWTMTIWRDEAAVEEFLRSPTHRAAIRAGQGALERAKFERFSWPRNAVPPSWEEVDARLERAPWLDYRTR